ncbi:unnamed protein product [Bursaphelenchus okinawaensis]|uniref:Uncharacterized protein n=1 Tax=Bursaphelenchus okinawaensis TaxID=465554 RepID=A0A811KIR7_9BILA|nr:unnamed protein product [Bursaphelenchus okinawaensis]CAG9105464.1 unnamed protein product [Bursaphelenchus okinawaensis]
MAYSVYNYNYQVAIIFAILIAALLLLAAVILGLYYAFVASTRKPKGGSRFTRTPSTLPPKSQWQQPQQVFQPQYPPQQYQQDYGQPQDYPQQQYGYDPRQQPQEYQYDPRQQPDSGNYSQAAPANQGYPSETLHTVKVRELQPEYIYQQGPVTWTTTQTVVDPNNYNQAVQQAQANVPSYHMSSV